MKVPSRAQSIFLSTWHYLWLAFLIALAFSPLLAGRIILHWDILVFDLPRSLFMSDAFRSGVIPLWNPFQDCGTSFFSDPLNGMWYPFSHLIIWLTGYSLAALEFEYLFHVFLAGCGAAWLARRMGLSQLASAGAATAYMLSGIFIGHAQHLQVIVGFAWLPFMMAAVEGMARENRVRDPVIFCLSLVMQILGGYPAVAIFSLVFSLAYFLVCLLQRWSKEGGKEILSGPIVRVSLAVILGLGLSSVLLIPSFSDLPLYSDRVGEFEYEMALNNESLPVSGMISLLIPSFPLLGMPGDRALGADPSMLSIYFGVLALFLSLFALIKASHPRLMPWAGIGLAGLLLALGERGILRALSIEFIPLFDSFRHSALFRVVFILAFSLIAGIGLEHLIHREPDSRKSLRKFLLSGVILLAFSWLLASVLYLIFYGQKSPQAEPLCQIFLGQIPFAILILFLAYLFCSRVNISARLGIALLALMGLDGVLMVQTLSPLLGEALNPKLRSYLEVVEKNRPRSFAALTSLKREDSFGMYDMTGMARKVFQTGDYNPFQPRIYMKVCEKGFHKIAAKEPRYYLSSKVSMVTDEKSALALIEQASKKNGFPAMVDMPPPSGIEIEQDLILAQEEFPENAVQVMEYSINTVKLRVFADTPALLASSESFHPGWSATLDGKKAELIRVNLAFRGIYIPTPGRHQVVFLFRPRSFQLGALLSFVSLALGIGLVLAQVLLHKRGSAQEL